MKHFLIHGLFCLGLISTVSCAHRADAPVVQTATTTVSFQNITCSSCGDKVIEALKAEAGIKTLNFESKNAELTVVHDPSIIDGQAILTKVKTLYDCELGEGKGSYVTAPVFPEDADVKWLTRKGESVDLVQNLVSDKVTVVDFYAEWCGPCREIDKAMVSILKEADDVALRKIDIIDWESPAAKEHLTQASTLPYVMVFNKDGTHRATIAGLDIMALEQAITEARQ